MAWSDAGQRSEAMPVLALGAILLYHIILPYQHQRQQPVGIDIKALLRAA